MVYLQTISMVLIALLLLSMMAQAHPWKKLKMPGKVLRTLPMNILQRINFHRSSLMAVMFGIFLGRAMGFLPISLAAFAGILTAAVLLMPMQYTFTTQGVAVGQAIFRPWKEFTHITQKNNQVVFEHPSFFGRLTLHVKPAEVENVLPIIRKS